MPFNKETKPNELSYIIKKLHYNGVPLKLVEQLIYLGSNISSTERLKSDLSDKIKREFFLVVAVSVLLCNYIA